MKSNFRTVNFFIAAVSIFAVAILTNVIDRLITYSEKSYIFSVLAFFILMSFTRIFIASKYVMIPFIVSVMFLFTLVFPLDDLMMLPFDILLYVGVFGFVSTFIYLWTIILKLN